MPAPGELLQDNFLVRVRLEERSLAKETKNLVKLRIPNLCVLGVDKTAARSAERNRNGTGHHLEPTPARKRTRAGPFPISGHFQETQSLDNPIGCGDIKHSPKQIWSSGGAYHIYLAHVQDRSHVDALLYFSEHATQP